MKGRFAGKNILHFDSTSREYYWVYGYTGSGKKVTLGPYIDAGEADKRASKLDDANVYALPTRDRGRAVQMIRSKLLKQGEDIDKTLERQLGRRGLAQEEKREHKRGFKIFRR